MNLSEINLLLTRQSENRRNTKSVSDIIKMVDSVSDKIKTHYDDQVFLSPQADITFRKSEIDQFSKAASNDKITNDKKFKIYGMSYIGKNKEPLLNCYRDFEPFNAIIAKGTTKFNQRVIDLSFKCSLSEQKYFEIIDLVNNDVNTCLYENGYQSITDFLTRILFENIVYGVSYVYADGDDIALVEQENLRCMYSYNGISQNPLYYIIKVDFLDKMLESLSTSASTVFNQTYTDPKNNPFFIASSVKTLEKLTLITHSNYQQLLKDKNIPYLFRMVEAENVHITRLFPYSEGLRIPSLIELFIKELTAISILKNILNETTVNHYSNLWFIKLTDIMDKIKPIAAAGVDLIKDVIKDKNNEDDKFIKDLKTTTNNGKHVSISNVVDDVMILPKDTKNRELLLDEYSFRINKIFQFMGVDLDFINSTNKRNENVQVNELEDFFSGYIYNLNPVFKNIYKPKLKKRLKDAGILEEEIDIILQTFKVSFEENGVLTIEDKLKLSSFLTSSSTCMSINEIRRQLNLRLVDDNFESLTTFTAKSNQVGEESSTDSKPKENKSANAVANNNAGMTKNQYGTKDPSSSSINK